MASDDRLKKTESSSVQGVISESAANIASVLKRGEKIYALLSMGFPNKT